MEVVFLKFVNMSITASWLVLAIIAVRLIFRKTPKWILCLLWGLVALRLICPFSIESALSLIPSAEPLPQEIIYTAQPEIQSGVAIIDEAVNPVLDVWLTPVSQATSANPTQIFSFIFSQIWILGMALMLVYTLVSFLLMKRKVATAIPLEKGIKQSEFVDTPFVLGFLRPVIYLPFGMAEGDMAYVLAHEKAHIRRRDHWWKPIGFLLLSIYWFNPVMWVAYILLCRDIEAACDEKVIKDMGKDDRRAYSKALLNCSIHRRRIAACPLAFGEVGVKTRVKSVMNYRKPTFWVIITCLIIMIVVSVCFLTNPESDAAPISIVGQTMEVSEVVYQDPRFSSIWTEIDTPYFAVTQDCYLLTKDGDPFTAVNEQRIWVNRGAFEAIDLKSSNFDSLFYEWDSADEVRRENQQAWKCTYEDENGVNFLYLLRQKNNDLYLAYGYDRSGEENGETLIRWLHRLRISPETDWSVSLSVFDVTSTGAFLVVEQVGAVPDGELSYGNWYSLQRHEEAGWVDVPTLTDGIFTTEAHIVKPDSPNYDQIDWTSYYGELPQGLYRIKKTISLRKQSGEDENRNFYGEFVIGHIDNTYISYTVQNVTPTGLDLLIHEKEPENGTIVTGNRYFLQALTENGWMDIEPVPGESLSIHCLIHIKEEPERHELNWSSTYGELSPGMYRVGSEYTLSDVELPMVFKVYGEFTIGEQQYQNWSDSLNTFLTDHTYKQVSSGMGREDIQVLATLGNYGLIYAGDEGYELILCRFGEKMESQDFVVTGFTNGELAISGGISINHVQIDDQYIYFGTVNQSYWNPIDDSVIPMEVQTLKIVGENGEEVEMALNGHSGYLSVLSTPLAEFEIIDSADNIVLDLSTYLEQGYEIQEQTMLLAAIGIDGISGFVKADDLDGYQPSNSEEAAAYMEEREKRIENGSEKYVRYIPLYAEDGSTVIGQFGIG